MYQISADIDVLWAIAAYIWAEGPVGLRGYNFKNAKEYHLNLITDKIAGVTFKDGSFLDFGSSSIPWKSIERYRGHIQPISSVTNKIPCAHTWRAYQGLMESYDFCEKCDTKRR